ncbi:hypothetical protein O9929_21860 [Vibrio lentus]|nr:hypothetical protein [Vibrio lentus]
MRLPSLREERLLYNAGLKKFAEQNKNCKISNWRRYCLVRRHQLPRSKICLLWALLELRCEKRKACRGELFRTTGDSTGVL